MRHFLPTLLLLTAAPLAAQSADAPIGMRVDRLEKEMRAVQRKVFPQGQGAYFEPEITTPDAPPPAASDTPTTAPLADLAARVDSLERELARMTGQVEEQDHWQRQLQDAVDQLKADTGRRLAALERTGTPPAAGTDAPPPEDVPPPAPRDADAAPAAAPPPASGDPAEAAYMAGYDAWTAKDYDKAETLLKAAVVKYPNSRRASYAQNLLGRTYLDSGRPAAAAVAFHKNYTSNPKGERAPDSLYYLGQALMKLDKPNPAKACEAYDALTREYGGTIGAPLKDRVAKARVDAKCAAKG